jgi:hypothetical protein
VVSLVVMYASRFRNCLCAERNRIGGARKKRGSQKPRATLRQEVHAAQEVLEARVGAPGVPIPPCTEMNQGRLRSWQASSSHSRARSFSPAWAHTVAPYARPEHRFDLTRRQLLRRQAQRPQLASLGVAARLASCGFTIACRGKRHRDAELQRRPNKKRGSGL